MGKNIKPYVILLLVALFLFVVSPIAWFSHKNAHLKPTMKFKLIGTTFSIPYAEWLHGKWNGPKVGPTWEECLEQICKLGVQVIRLTMQWNETEISPKEYHWVKIDKALKICAKYKIPVVICLGAKSPRAPEFHIPDFYKVEVFKFKGDLNQGIGRDLRDFLEGVLKKYGQDPRIEAFQVENEPLDPIGFLGFSIPNDFLNQEIDFVRSKTKKPIIVTMGAGLTDATADDAQKIRLPIVESLTSLKVQKIGLNIYQEGTINERIFKATDDHWSLARKLVQKIKIENIVPVLAEVQAEPWENDPSKIDFKNPDGNSSLDPKTYEEIFTLAGSLESNEVWVWGLETQVACAEQGNTAWLEMTKKLIEKNSER